MKRIVSAKYDKDIHPAFYELQNDAYNRGYDLDVDNDFNITLNARDGKDLMPIITTKTNCEDGVYFYDVNVTFPTLRSSQQGFKDDIEYYTYKFYQVGRFITRLIEFSFNPSDYEE